MRERRKEGSIERRSCLGKGVMECKESEPEGRVGINSSGVQVNLGAYSINARFLDPDIGHLSFCAYENTAVTRGYRASVTIFSDTEQDKFLGEFACRLLRVGLELGDM